MRKCENVKMFPCATFILRSQLETGSLRTTLSMTLSTTLSMTLFAAVADDGMEGGAGGGQNASKKLTCVHAPISCIAAWS
jgi:hypothetical protein